MKTPYEIVYGHKPMVANLRAFGCPCTLLNLETTPKFGAKVEDCYFVGYASRIAYRVYNKSTKKIVESYYVRCIEEEENYDHVGHDWSLVLGIDPLESLDTTQPLPASQQESVTETVSSPELAIDASSVEGIEPKSVEMALQDPSWVDAMHEELNQFEKLKVWRLVELPVGKKTLDTNWVFHNKQNDNGVIVRNKARLVVRDFCQVESLDYTEVYALVALLESIWIFLAYAS
ncbi:uncharacterized protein LOC143568429 [Bidens hawaiensis]|uniref:uncharacterized protein LOC143568429 n=1 Tax=Bidens hawaiensis TaxID=980011 RepID=UPI00404A0F61